MTKKKMNFESNGFVRRLMKKGASFTSRNGGDLLNESFSGNSYGRFGNNIEGKIWRPRKNQFERLDGDDDDSLSAAAAGYENPSSWDKKITDLSTESDVGEYRRGIMFEQRATALKTTPSKKITVERKRELSPLKPPGKDTSTTRLPVNSMKKIPQKKQKQDMEWGHNGRQDSMGPSRAFATTTNDDPFFTPTTDSFGFEIHENYGRENSSSAKKAPSQDEDSIGSRQTQTHSSYNTVTSDPTDFFSKEQTTELTMGNLAKMDSAFDSSTATATATAEKMSATDRMEKLVKERKFYQFAVDDDKASTVVESTIKLPINFPGIDDYTEVSCDETSQGTRIQQRSVTSETVPELKSKLTGDDTAFFSQNIIKKTMSKTVEDASRNRVHQVEKLDAFFPESNSNEKSKGKEFGDIFPPGIERDDFLPGFGGAEQSRQSIPKAETDVSSFLGDDYFDSRHMSTNNFGSGSKGSIQSRQGRHEYRHPEASTKSLSYSPSPVHKINNTTNGRQPLTLKNSQSNSIGTKNNTYQLNAAANKSDDWFPSENIPDVDTHFQFENFDPQQSSSKKRHSSISSANFQAPPTDHFESSFPNNASAKENVAAKYNRLEAANDSWGMGGKRQSLRRQENPAVHNSVHDDDDDISGDDDSFDEIGEWKRPTTTYFERRMIGTQNTSLNRARLTRHEQHTSPYNRLSRNRYIDDYDDDEVRSASGFSVGKSSMASSRTKPLTLPSNAIMGSMLFQTQHDIDQSDVEQKINAFDRENSRQKDIRHSRGGIPDAVTADDDYMTTVSSFSESTSAYLQEPWRKPSRDLLNHFTSARTLDMDYRQRPIRTSRMEESQGLFEA
eukprot:CAMPEP_0201148620 /NCGR_PEP_ID=MMETSP0851-20130426/10045_1 /ASSEMBLY_ACC=CAM_ASM_000631 /TAXON_ID=183588 /ORGANISM="Pseudo-nitzschia fraudulenta, Strain WWA7" /LENGTH=841 /DNA_ID=CAMNT_0047424819 /DNA_START=159 /DNA_END=2684 /DNA_ORIENTATION=-